MNIADALPLHDGQSGHDAVQHTVDIDVDHPVPLVDFSCFRRRQRHPAGIVDQHIDTAMGVLREGREGLHIVRARPYLCA